MLGTLVHDFEQAVRSLRRAPAYSALVVAVMALGLGACTFAATFMLGGWLRPLPFRAAHELVQVVGYPLERGPGAWTALSPPDYVDLIERQRVFTAVASYYGDRVAVRLGDDFARVNAASVTPSLFEVLGVGALRGRVFEAADAPVGGPRDAVLISEGFWRTRLGAREDVVGMTLWVQGGNATVVGVMPAGFGFPHAAELWMPFAPNAAMAPRDARWMPVLARLRPGVSPEQARLEMGRFAEELAREHPSTNAGASAAVVPATEFLNGTLRDQALLFTAAAVLLLLLVCANVANLIHARSARRERETSVRGALGATPARLVREALAEVLLLCGAGALLGVWLARLAAQGLMATGAGPAPFWLDLTPGPGVWLVTAGATLLAVLLSGLGPALRAARPDALASLRESGNTTTESPRAARLRRALVSIEIALSVVLLSGAAVLVQAFLRLSDERRLIDRADVVVSRLTVPGSMMFGEGAAAGRRFESRLRDELRSLPGIEDAATAAMLPFDALTNFRDVRAEADDDPRRREGVPSNLALVSPEYFRALGLPLVAGRSFTADDDADAPRVAIVSQTLARRLAPGGDAVGRRFFAGSANDSLDWTTIVGVVPDFVLNAEQADTRAMFFRPWGQDGWWSADRWLVVRKAKGATYPAAAVRRLVASLAPEIPISDVQTLEQFIDLSISGRRSTGAILTVFAVAGLLVAVLGLHGVVAYAMSLRTREIGIRMALGADRERLLAWVLGGALRTIVVGLAGGVVASVLVRWLLPDLVAGSPARDLPILVVVAALVAVTGIAAAFAPAWRATRIEPSVALRHD